MTDPTPDADLGPVLGTGASGDPTEVKIDPVGYTSNSNAPAAVVETDVPVPPAPTGNPPAETPPAETSASPSEGA